MASGKTVRKAHKIISQLIQIFGREIHPPFATMFDPKGKIIIKWEGSDPLVKARKQGPGTMEQIYRKLPRETLLRFVIPTNAPTIEPTQEEWEDFERALLTMARRVVIRQVRKEFKRLSKGLPEPTKRKRGRPPRKEERVRLVQQAVKEWLDSRECKTKTDAVKKAAEVFGDPGPPLRPLHIDTIYRYLRAASQARRARPRSTKRSGS